jgi:hypothetical protein
MCVRLEMLSTERKALIGITAVLTVIRAALLSYRRETILITQLFSIFSR